MRLNDRNGENACRSDAPPGKMDSMCVRIVDRDEGSKINGFVRFVSSSVFEGGAGVIRLGTEVSCCEGGVLGRRAPFVGAEVAAMVSVAVVVMRNGAGNGGLFGICKYLLGSVQNVYLSVYQTYR